MSTTLREVIQNSSVPMSQKEREKEETELQNKHRSRTELDRPDKEVTLSAILPDDFEPRKEQLDPTKDLVILPRVVNEVSKSLFNVSCEDVSYIIYCSWTEETWWAPTKICLDKNFIYREDIDIYEVGGPKSAYKKAVELTKSLYPGVLVPKICYILDDPANESYEVYHTSNFPKLKYGKSTPDGMFVHKYKNRFHRDMSIMELDKLYSEQSSRKAGKLIAKGYEPNEAIIISDGCWLRNSCSASFIYLDNDDVVQLTKGFSPSDPSQSVLIAEITGAKEAIKYAVGRGKTKITYYYDNSSIVNILRNKRMEYLSEVADYKKMLYDIDKNTDIQITFVDIHPKTDECRRDENRALMFFHNLCDMSCRRMTDIFKKDYKMIATNGGKNGDKAADMMGKFRPREKSTKPRNYQSYNRSNRYEKR